jgi:hypothetical protein
MHIVEWVSADIASMTGGAGASPRYVDAGDVAAWQQLPTGAVRWGFESEDPPSSPTFQADFAPLDDAGQNDAAEAAAMATALGTSCSAGKPTEEANLEARAIMEWFGLALTGQDVLIAPGISAPGWDLVDPAQRTRAIADPYGYQANLRAAARSVSWSAAKYLYR